MAREQHDFSINEWVYTEQMGLLMVRWAHEPMAWGPAWPCTHCPLQMGIDTRLA